MKRYQTRVPGSIAKTRLDHFLMEWLPNALGQPISRSKIRTLFFSGAVYVNRHRNKNGLSPVYAGAVIEVYYDEDKLSDGTPRIDKIRFDTSRVIYEDEWLIIVDKPSGIPTQPTLDPFRANLFDIMKRFLADREKVEETYVGLHHRLDKDTSGLVLFTKREEANKGISDLFLKHEIQKTYQCMAWRGPGSPKYEANEKFQIENFLRKVSEKGETSRYGAVKSGGDYALTYFRVIEAFRDVYWMEAQPQTGRTHQIRVHCSENLTPILGDPFYFPEDLAPFIAVPRLLLHAYKLDFKHPITGRQISVTANIPDEFLQVLGSLKS
jgi:RluA family pseudouridine synthase